MISYQTLYWIVALVIYLWFNLQENSFDDGVLPLSGIWCLLHKLVGGSKFTKGSYKPKHSGGEYWVDDKRVSTFVSRFRVGLLLYIMSWVVWFIIF
jgi:hypothetical protein